jgi:hypothetical protein
MGRMDRHANGEIHLNVVVRSPTQYKWRDVGNKLLELGVLVNFGSNVKSWVEALSMAGWPLSTSRRRLWTRPPRSGTKMAILRPSRRSCLDVGSRRVSSGRCALQNNYDPHCKITMARNTHICNAFPTTTRPETERVRFVQEIQLFLAG